MRISRFSDVRTFYLQSMKCACAKSAYAHFVIDYIALCEASIDQIKSFLRVLYNVTLRPLSGYALFVDWEGISANSAFLNEEKCLLENSFYRSISLKWSRIGKIEKFSISL